MRKVVPWLIPWLVFIATIGAFIVFLTTHFAESWKPLRVFEFLFLILGPIFIGFGLHRSWKFSSRMALSFGIIYCLIGTAITVLYWSISRHWPAFSSVQVTVQTEDGVPIPDSTVKVFYACEMMGMENNMSLYTIASKKQQTDTLGIASFSPYQALLPISGAYYFRTSRPCGKYIFVGKNGYCAYGSCAKKNAGFALINKSIVLKGGGYNSFSAVRDYQGVFYFARIDADSLQIDVKLHRE
ncbi:MAG: hypothetical protein O3A80_01110 [bacterium]|nr:hypothetical protein [bacterium]MDA1292433.1 hypothetical protein [bacterium]